MKYINNNEFDIEKMKTDNMLTATALIKKQKVLEVGGYSVANRYVNEDWHLWLRLMQINSYPIKLNFYGFWYRRKKDGLLKEINNPENTKNNKRLNEIKKEANKIKHDIKAINYPIIDIQENNIEQEFNISNFKKINSNKRNILIIVKYLKDDALNKIITRYAKKFDLTIITVIESIYIYRQKYEQIAEVFDMNTFLKKRNWKKFIEYIINTRNIHNVVIINNTYGERIIEDLRKTNLNLNLNVDIYNYEEHYRKYNKDIRKYKRKKILKKVVKKILKK